MSTGNPGADGLDLRAELARIDRDRAETAKFAAEQRKLTSEADKLRADKLRAEELKLLWDRRLSPWVIGASIIGSMSGGAIVAVLAHVWR